MYGTWAELVDGYTKSLWASPGAAAGAALLLAWYALPPLAAVGGAVAGAWPVAAAGTVGYLLGVAGRVVSAAATGGRAWPDALAHPVSVTLFAWLVARSRRRRHTVTWRGRSVVTCGSR
jgi:hypothetical protein